VDTDLAVYFGRCNGVFGLILEMLLVRAGLGEGLVYSFEALMMVASTMVELHHRRRVPAHPTLHAGDRPIRGATPSAQGLLDTLIYRVLKYFLQTAHLGTLAKQAKASTRRDGDKHEHSTAPRLAVVNHGHRGIDSGMWRRW